ncbi:uncharacterized protein LAJ45_01155 [Morchella importuna]|uniref:uncharacterized protein n=1 Tax=Morchella importuna TaxID=1174673 RepID=UPI001E8E634A|nr:uncharacterized protein LAJ45_01155 [Morchella importuna]KAH8154627.1 hypothetical protein LAJ45_01155 [Morchella importuna]
MFGMKLGARLNLGTSIRSAALIPSLPSSALPSISASVRLTLGGLQICKNTAQWSCKKEMEEHWRLSLTYPTPLCVCWLGGFFPQIPTSSRPGQSPARSPLTPGHGGAGDEAAGSCRLGKDNPHEGF